MSDDVKKHSTKLTDDELATLRAENAKLKGRLAKTRRALRDTEEQLNAAIASSDIRERIIFDVDKPEPSRREAADRFLETRALLREIERRDRKRVA